MSKREHDWDAAGINDVCKVCGTPAPAGRLGVTYPSAPCPGPLLWLPADWPSCGYTNDGRICTGRSYYFTGGFYRAGDCATCGNPINAPRVLVDGKPAPVPAGVVVPWVEKSAEQRAEEERLALEHYRAMFREVFGEDARCDRCQGTVPTSAAVVEGREIVFTCPSCRLEVHRVPLLVGRRGC